MEAILAAIVDDDKAEVAKLLKASPDLATCLINESLAGCSRTDSKSLALKDTKFPVIPISG